MPEKLRFLAMGRLNKPVIIVLLLAFQDGRRFLMKLFFLIRNMLGIDIGIRGVVQLALYSALPAIAVAFNQGYRDSSQKGL